MGIGAVEGGEMTAREQWREAWSAYRAMDGSFQRLERAGSVWASVVYRVRWMMGDLLLQRELAIREARRVLEAELRWRRADIVRRTSASRGAK